MYTMFCASLRNLLNDFGNKEDVRIRCMLPYTLLLRENIQSDESLKQNHLYEKLQDYLAFFDENRQKYPQFQAFLWTLESRGITSKRTHAASLEEISQQLKIFDDILHLAYW